MTCENDYNAPTRTEGESDKAMAVVEIVDLPKKIQFIKIHQVNNVIFV